MPVLPAKAGWGSTSDRTLLLLVACAACSRTAWEKSAPQARGPAPRDQALGTGAKGGDRHPWRGRRHRRHALSLLDPAKSGILTIKLMVKQIVDKPKGPLERTLWEMHQIEARAGASQQPPTIPSTRASAWRAKRDPEAKLLSLQSFLRKGVSLGHVGRN